MSQSTVDPIVTGHYESLSGLLSGTVKPSRVVGRGYKNPKSVASAWLRKEIHNLENLTAKVDKVVVTSSGKAFSSDTRAMMSKCYRSLVDGSYGVRDKVIITDYGVMPAPGGDGKMVYICTR